MLSEVAVLLLLVYLSRANVCVILFTRELLRNTHSVVEVGVHVDSNTG
jgi:hypothetical protein